MSPTPHVESYNDYSPSIITTDVILKLLVNNFFTRPRSVRGFLNPRTEVYPLSVEYIRGLGGCNRILVSPFYETLYFPSDFTVSFTGSSSCLLSLSGSLPTPVLRCRQGVGVGGLSEATSIEKPTTKPLPVRRTTLRTLGRFVSRPSEASFHGFLWESCLSDRSSFPSDGQ